MTPTRPVSRRLPRLVLGLALAAAAGVGSAEAPVQAAPAHQQRAASLRCRPDGLARSYTDGLDKLDYHGAVLGGLSSLAWDPRASAFVSAVDNHLTDPARIWFIRNLADPRVIRDPLVLRKPDGTAYDGTTSDNEGLAVLPGGDYLVSSETEPSIRIYGRDGVQKTALPIPANFAVTGTTPDGQATSNQTLEGLTLTPRGNKIVAAMEGPLSGDVSSAGDATAHRFLIYRRRPHHAWFLAKQIAYRTDVGLRVAEVAAYRDGSFLVEEAAFSPTRGNSVYVYDVTGLQDTPDVSAVPNLSDAPAADFVTKTRAINLVQCPTLGAPALEPQVNPLLDNFEGMAFLPRRLPDGTRALSLIADDNFSAGQHTRVLNLSVRLPD